MENGRAGGRGVKMGVHGWGRGRGLRSKLFLTSLMKAIVSKPFEDLPILTFVTRNLSNKSSANGVQLYPVIRRMVSGKTPG